MSGMLHLTHSKPEMLATLHSIAGRSVFNVKYTGISSWCAGCGVFFILGLLHLHSLFPFLHCLPAALLGGRRELADALSGSAVYR
ncbi:hypothetical protein FKM82_004439 [Ascaphus truei]